MRLGFQKLRKLIVLQALGHYSRHASPNISFGLRSLQTNGQVREGDPNKRVWPLRGFMLRRPPPPKNGQM